MDDREIDVEGEVDGCVVAAGLPLHHQPPPPTPMFGFNVDARSFHHAHNCTRCFTTRTFVPVLDPCHCFITCTSVAGFVWKRTYGGEEYPVSINNNVIDQNVIKV